LRRQRRFIHVKLVFTSHVKLLQSSFSSFVIYNTVTMRTENFESYADIIGFHTFDYARQRMVISDQWSSYKEKERMMIYESHNLRRILCWMIIGGKMIIICLKFKVI